MRSCSGPNASGRTHSAQQAAKGKGCVMERVRLKAVRPLEVPEVDENKATGSSSPPKARAGFTVSDDAAHWQLLPPATRHHHAASFLSFISIQRPEEAVSTDAINHILRLSSGLS